MENFRYKNDASKIVKNSTRSGKYLETQLNLEFYKRIKKSAGIYNWHAVVFSVTSEQVTKAIEPVKHLKNLKFNNIGWKYFEESTKSGRDRETKLKSEC